MKVIWILVISFALGGLYFVISSWRQNLYLNNNDSYQSAVYDVQNNQLEKTKLQATNNAKLEEAIRAVEANFNAAAKQDEKQTKKEGKKIPKLH